MNYIDFNLDEDYCFRVSSVNLPLSAGCRLEIPFYGVATIAYNDDEDWWLSSLTLSASMDNTGEDSDGWEEPIDSADYLFGVVKKYLATIQRERVEEMIRQDMQAQHESYLFDLGKERAKMRGAA